MWMIFYHEEPSAAQPQPKLGLSLAKTQRPQRSEKMVRIVCRTIYLSPPNLACFAPWREKYPCPRVFDSRKICANRANC